MQALGGRSVHQGSLSSLSRAVGSLGPLAHAPCVVRFIGCRWVESCAPWGVDGFIQGIWVHSCASWGTFGSLVRSLEIVRVIRCHWVHIHAPWWPLGLSGDIWFTCARPLGRWVHSSRVPWGSFRSSGAVGFTRARQGGRWVHSVSLSSLARVRPGFRCVH